MPDVKVKHMKVSMEIKPNCRHNIVQRIFINELPQSNTNVINVHLSDRYLHGNSLSYSHQVSMAIANGYTQVIGYIT